MAPISVSSPSPFHWYSLQPPCQLAGSPLSPSPFDEPLKTREVTLMRNSPFSHNFFFYLTQKFPVEVLITGGQVRVPPHCSLMLCSQKPQLVLVQYPFSFPLLPTPPTPFWGPHDSAGYSKQQALRLVLLLACPNCGLNKEATREDVSVQTVPLESLSFEHSMKVSCGKRLGKSWKGLTHAPRFCHPQTLWCCVLEWESSGIS